MKIFVAAKTGKKETRVIKIDSSHYIVHVMARPVGGKANAAIIEALANYFGIAPSRLQLMRGHHYKEKTVEIV